MRTAANVVGTDIPRDTSAHIIGLWEHVDRDIDAGQAGYLGPIGVVWRPETKKGTWRADGDGKGETRRENQAESAWPV